MSEFLPEHSILVEDDTCVHNTQESDIRLRHARLFRLLQDPNNWVIFAARRSQAMSFSLPTSLSLDTRCRVSEHRASTF